MSERIDRFGAVASSLCAVHCAVCALLPAAFSVLGLGILVSHEVEWVFTLVAVVFACVAMIVGWRQHRSLLVVGLLLIGIIGLFVSRKLEMDSPHHGHHDAHHSAAIEKVVGDKESHEHKAEHQAEHKAEHKVEHKAEHKAEHQAEHKAGHHESSADHDDDALSLGAVVGVFAGLLIFIGHLLNIRATRQCAPDCCA